jgi:hypothetical protein
MAAGRAKEDGRAFHAFEHVLVQEICMISFFRKHKVFSLVTILVILLASWYLFRPEKLFINKRVNEAAPFASKHSEERLYTGLFS